MPAPRATDAARATYESELPGTISSAPRSDPEDFEDGGPVRRTRKRRTSVENTAVMRQHVREITQTGRVRSITRSLSKGLVDRLHCSRDFVHLEILD